MNSIKTPDSYPSSVFAEKSILSEEYRLFLRHLKWLRKEAGLTQAQLGERLGQSQAIVSKCERGERRLDVIELRAYCYAAGVSYLNFLQELEKEFSDSE